MQGSEPGTDKAVKEIQYDIIGHPAANFTFAVTFPFHPATEASAASVTIIREYCQGPNTVLYNLPTGACLAQ